MHARLLDKSEEELWDNFAESHPFSTIHQTSKWGHFQAHRPSRGKYWIIGVFEGKKLIGGSMLIRYLLPKNHCWLYTPRGPLARPEMMPHILEQIKKIATEENAIFLRIDPPLQKAINYDGFKTTSKGHQPEHTLILDLDASEEALLKQMKQKGRYNIKIAENKGVKIHKANPKFPNKFAYDLGKFYHILQQTTKRDRFHSHGQGFYKAMIETLYPGAALYLANYEGEEIAGAIITYHKDTATYYYGASSDTHRNAMAPYLLHWEAMKDAKKKGFKYYDLFGISPPHSKNHHWKGVTEFKKKFGGTHVSYQKAQEYPFKKFMYFLYRLYKALR
ncbi:MAG: peptidoglycan bridge formation glycyltransferase FemA/FemB family protein [bacterium]|nr:peptidoglycan bridge formation glycyltransferase FemA/FemB family protein [bacterium]